MLSKTPVRWGTIVITLSNSFKGNPRQTFKLSINCMASKICLSNDILLNSCSTPRSFLRSTLHSCKCVVPENIHTPPPPRKGSDFPGGMGRSICLIFQWGGGVTRGKYFQRVLVTHKRVTKNEHKNLPGQFICEHIKHNES